jgi:hypothetical protein
MIRAGMKPPPPMAIIKSGSAMGVLVRWEGQGGGGRTEFGLDALCGGLAEEVDVVVCLSEAVSGTESGAISRRLAPATYCPSPILFVY